MKLCLYMYSIEKWNVLQLSSTDYGEEKNQAVLKIESEYPEINVICELMR